MATKLTKKDKAHMKKMGISIDPITSSELKISMSTTVSVGQLVLAGKKVEIITYITGAQALIIDDVLYKPEIMVYTTDEVKDEDENLTLNDLGIDVGDVDGSYVEEIPDNE